MPYVPEFPGFDELGIFLRGDGFCRAQEFSRWPQLYSQSLSHYSAIPAKPTHISDKFWNSILFRDFSCNDWQPVTPLPPVTESNWTVVEFAGGFLQKDLWTQLKVALEQAISTCLSGHEVDTVPVYALARALHNIGQTAIQRLEGAPDSCSQVIFTVRDVLRVALELLGIYEWMNVIRIRLSSKHVYPPGQYIGCFTSKLVEMDMLYCAGIPVWYIRTKSSILPSMDLGPEVYTVLVSDTLLVNRWICVNGSFLYSREIKDAGRIRDYTGLVYDGNLYKMMERMKNFWVLTMQEHLGTIDLSSAELSSGASDKKHKDDSEVL